MGAVVRLMTEECSVYKKNIIFLTCIFLLFGCMDKTKLNNEGDAASSIEKKKENPSPKGTFYTKDHFLILEKKRLIKLILPMKLIVPQSMQMLKNPD